MRRVAALLALALALASGCSQRERANPFDPGNPVTGGRPAGFSAFAGYGLVQLRWTRPAIAGDFGFQLFRRVEGEPDFRPLGAPLSGSSTGYLDPSLANGLRHEYRLYYVFSGTRGGLPAEDMATPGPLRPWFADLARRTLIGSTPDGRHVATELGGFFGPTHVAVDASRGAVWLSDTYDGRVVIYDPSLGGRISIAGLAEPVALAIDPVDQSAWVCDQGRDAVYHYRANGAPATPAQLPGIDTPIGIAIDRAAGTIWVCERGGDRVRRFSRTGVPLGQTALFAPSRVAVDSANGDAWVTSFEGRRVVRFSASGAAQDTVSALSGPVGIALDARRGRIWVADARAGEVVALRRGGAVEFRTGGLTGVREIAVDLASGEAWATVPGLGAVVRLTEAGAVRERLAGFSDPYGIALDPGFPRPP